MKAIVINQFGGPEVFEIRDQPRPTVLPGQVLLRVKATSVNPIDTKIRSGLVPALAPEFPAILHGDAAGIVAEVGPGVTSFQPGDEVYGFAGGIKGIPGALADFMLVDAALLARKPQSLTMLEAAALPVVALTAWQGLLERAKLQANQTVLIHGATGGVGHIALQIAKWVGARTYATVSSAAKEALAYRLGADTVINYKQKTPAEYVQQYTDGNGFDVVFDTVGGSNLDHSFTAAASNGTVVSIATRSTHDLTPLHSKGLSLHVVFTLLPLLTGIGRSKQSQILTSITELCDAGVIRPLLDPNAFSIDQVTAAHRYLESGQAIGKVVLANEA